MIESRARFFPGIPIIFCGSSEEMRKAEGGLSFYGCLGATTAGETFKAALHFTPAVVSVQQNRNSQAMRLKTAA